MPAQAQALAQVAVAVQLAVEHHGDIPGFIPDGLLASSQVDDAQPAHAQRQSGRTRFAHKESFFIRAAVPHRRGHRPHSRLRLRITRGDRKSTRLNSSHGYISYAVFCLKKKKKDISTQIYIPSLF